VRHLVAAAGVLPQAPRAPTAYLEAVFDGYAPRFESHLISLGYRAPGLLRAALLRHIAPDQEGPIGPILDLGCGTGLMGVVLSDLNLGGLVGVDASDRMLDEARRKGLYSELLHTDLETMLHLTIATWSVVIAADVLCYFGALDRVMAAVHARMPPGGLFLFTVEELSADEAAGEPWRLCRQGRYSHHTEHIAASAQAAGFDVRELRPEILRYEADAPVGGLLVVLQRGRHDG
jgi:predicted TPR repeat methyltransferase